MGALAIDVLKLGGGGEGRGCIALYGLKISLWLLISLVILFILTSLYKFEIFDTLELQSFEIYSVFGALYFGGKLIF